MESDDGYSRYIVVYDGSTYKAIGLLDSDTVERLDTRDDFDLIMVMDRGRRVVCSGVFLCGETDTLFRAHKLCVTLEEMAEVHTS